MGKHSTFTRRWLDRRFAETDDHGVYVAHQPIYGVGHPACEPLHGRRHARTFQMLRALARLDGQSVLDVGGAEGLFTHLARTTLGFDEAVSADLSIVAAQRAASLFGLPSLALSSHALPFEDAAFDVVVCSEVIEHVELPVETLAELRRVARRAMILTTEECMHDRKAIDAQLFRRCGIPHFERNIFHPDDLRNLFGEECELKAQMEGEEIEDGAGGAEIREWVRRATRHVGFVPGGIGVQMVAVFDDNAALATPRVDDDALLDAIVRRHVEPGTTITARQHSPLEGPLEGPLARCVCPATHGPLTLEHAALYSAQADRDYPIDRGVADLVLGMGPTDRDPTDEACTRRFAAAFGPDRADAALTLRSKLAMPLDPARTRWDFTLETDRRGWLPGTDLVERQPAEQSTDGWAFDSKSEMPWIISPVLGKRGADLAALEITMRLHNPAYRVDAGVGQMFWLTDENRDFSAERHHVFPVRNDGETHTYRIALDQVADWPTCDAEIVCLRIDPINGPCSVELVEFAVVPS